MSDICPSCGSDKTYETISDEWDDGYDVEGFDIEVLYGAVVCEACGWHEEFEADRRYPHYAPFGFGALLHRGYD
ncbi:MAG: hypothetical protein AAF126_00400 [Chloroflexota bacterium]